jgi:isocitrate dehydrogenase kinase/phosphatase
LPDERQVAACARAAFRAFTAWQRDFRAITRRGDERFARRDWSELAHDVVERLDLWAERVELALGVVRRTLGAGALDRVSWGAVREAYANRIAALGGRELGETFFNSLTRRLFATVGVDSAVEFTGDEGEAAPAAAVPPAVRVHRGRDDTAALAREMLQASPVAPLLARPAESAALVAREIDRALGGRPVETVEVLRPIFHRGFGGFLVGCVHAGGARLPLAVSLLNLEQGTVVDAVLLEENEVSIVFSFTRSYFLADLDDPAEAVPFLKRLMPRKPIGELYSALGYEKHGKTVLYRELRHHLAHSGERFVVAPGDRGLVMIVFTMPSYDVVFKVIRDRIPLPKTTAREEVRARYDLVFRHDRAGRLADAREFERLAFERARFSEELLEELARDAPETVRFEGDAVVFRQLYTERRMTPLNLYLQAASASDARAAVIDYGRAVRDLAASNIFPGDLLLKNFGVTRHGRVVFYDYDELCLLTDCRFRDLPASSSSEDELAGESWFYVGPRDVFPEEFRTFVGLPRDLLAVFESRHGELFHADWWRRMQRDHREGVAPRIFPYPRGRRLAGPGSALPAG